MSRAAHSAAARLPVLGPGPGPALRALPIAREFGDSMAQAGLPPLRASGIEILQLNLGKLCNQSCRHCHVGAGPERREVMDRATIEQCVAMLRDAPIATVDITGGAPELNPHFRWLVEQCRALGRHVIDRCNLTIIETPNHGDLPEFFARHDVEVVCSLPHYRALHTDRQRGAGVFEKSIRALRRLNEVGYGQGDPRRRLVLVTNPAGAFLPAAQAALEAEWKSELSRRHGVRFDALFTITNMPIARFLDWLVESGNLEAYMDKLVAAFNPAAAGGAMCRNMLSVSWDGALHDCDFNQMLEMPVHGSVPQHIDELDYARLASRPIEVDRHCYGCTAGAGSSCGGATA